MLNKTPNELLELRQLAEALLKNPSNQTLIHHEREQEFQSRQLDIYRMALELLQEELRTTKRMLETSQAIAKVGSVEFDIATKQLYWSPETYRIHDTTPKEYSPSLLDSLDHYAEKDRNALATALKRAQTHGELFDLEVQKKTFKGRLIDLRTTCTITLENGKPTKLTGIYQDITERKQAERRQQHHNRILEMLLNRIPLAQILDTITRDVEHINPSMLCSIVLLDEDGIHLRHGAAPSLPSDYIQAINGAAIGPSAGSCGSAIYSGQRVIVEDIKTHPYWADYRHLAKAANLQSCWSQPILSPLGKVLGSFAVYHRTPCTPTDADLALIESEAQLTALAIEKNHTDARLRMAASVFTHAREGIMITNAQGMIVEVNKTFSQITGYTRADVLGKNPRLLKSNEHSTEFFQHMWRDLIQDDFWSGELWNKRKDGTHFAAMMTISAVKNNNGTTRNYVNLFTDITPLKEHQQQLEYIAHYDALTQLPNRVLLADRLKQAIAHSHRSGSSLAVLYLDLDGFKTVNDNHGHSVGDQLLVCLAQSLKAALREGDTLARIGGDEFVIVLANLTDTDDYLPIVKRLLDTADEIHIIDNHPLRISASIGITLYPHDKAEADLLMRHADQAMYLAKQAGKNCYHLFDVAQDVATKSQHESIECIRTAFIHNEFVLYYQPKINMLNNEVIGAEALIRWQHPERGLLAPAAFLPTIENHSFSIELGEWVIASALQQILDWREAGLDLPVSVNVGALQLQQPHFAIQLGKILAKYPSVNPALLLLEILETSALEDINEVALLMQNCTRLGVNFAVDDFGTGYSSLTYLKRLPAQMLKIDQSFVRDMLDDTNDLAIIKGIIGLADAFHRQVIAEGVETLAHGKLLMSLGCDLAQGYGIARPMPATAMPKWVAQWQSQPNWIEVPDKK